VNPQSATPIIEPEEDGFVALHAGLDIASQGASVVEARANLKEAVALFLEGASAEEIEERLDAHARALRERQQ
jgi:predicted RNase H-like HicB family nuclease